MLPRHRLLELREDRTLRVAMPGKPSTTGKLETPCAKSQAQEGGKLMAQQAPVTISVVTPTGGYRVDGKINQIPISFLLDTGAAVTLIRKDVWS